MINYESVETKSERWLDLTPLLNEEWRDIKGYEGLYQVSNYGRVKSLKRHYILNGNKININEKILKAGLNKDSYYAVVLCSKIKNNYKNRTRQLHRLVAEAFIPNQENKPTVNHISGNKHDNRVCNLEWNTYSEQLNHSYKKKLREKPFGTKNNMFGKKGKLHPRSKMVYQYNLQGVLIKKWGNTYDIVRELGISQAGINQCCLGKMKKYKGFIWKY